MENEQPQREILWEEKRGNIGIRCIREGYKVSIEVGVVISITRAMHERDYETAPPQYIAQLKTELVNLVADACHLLYLDVHS